MSRINTPSNPLADVVWDELTPIFTAIYSATPSIELDGSRSAGIQIVEGGDRQYRTSTNAECYEVEFSLFIERATFDCRKPLFGQLSAWLKQVADQIDEACASLDRIEGVRDTVVVPRKKARTA